MDWLFIFIVVITIPLSMSLVNLWMMKHPVKAVNRYRGYRTKRSMKSQEAWDFAQRHNAQIMWRLGLVLTAVAVMIMLACYQVPIGQLGIVAVVLVVLTLMGTVVGIVSTEKALKAHFDDQGRRKLF